MPRPPALSGNNERVEIAKTIEATAELKAEGK